MKGRIAVRDGARFVSYSLYIAMATTKKVDVKVGEFQACYSF